MVTLSAVALSAGGVVAQVEAPDQGAAPPGSNSNMGDGTGAGPAGSIGDPNGVGPGAAAPDPGVSVVDQPPPPGGPRLSRGDAAILKYCLAMPTGNMNGIAKCKALMAKHPELFSNSPPPP